MSARLTPEQAEAVDSTTKEFEDASVEAASNHNADGLGLINCRILDLLDENASLRARAEQAERGDAREREVQAHALSHSRTKASVARNSPPIMASQMMSGICGLRLGRPAR